MNSARYVQIPRARLRGLIGWMQLQRDAVQRSNEEVDGIVRDKSARDELALIDRFLKELRVTQRRLTR